MTKTDWEIVRGLADWVMTLGLPQTSHQKWANGKQISFGEAKDYVQTYIDDDYVSLCVLVEHKEVHSIDIHLGTLSKHFTLDSKHQTPEQLIGAVKDYTDNLNIRYWNKVYRNKLRFLEKDAKKREAESNQARITKLKQELTELEA